MACTGVGAVDEGDVVEVVGAAARPVRALADRRYRRGVKVDHERVERVGRAAAVAVHRVGRIIVVRGRRRNVVRDVDVGRGLLRDGRRRSSRLQLALNDRRKCVGRVV